MVASPIVEVQDGAGPFTLPTNGLNVTAGNTVTIRLQSTVDVTQWTLQIYGVDEVTSTAPTLTDVNPTTHVVTTPSSTPTFVVPAGGGIGRAFIIRSAVNGGGGALTATFGLYALTTTGLRVGAIGEKFEGNSTFGWAATVNPAIRQAGGASGLPALANDQYAVLMEDPAGVLVFQRVTQAMIVGGGTSIGDVTIGDQVDTSDATATVIHTYSTTTGGTGTRSVIAYDLTVSAIERLGGSANFRIAATFESDGTTVTQKDVVYLNGPFRDDPAWNVDFNISGTDIQLRVTGSASEEMRWRAVGYLSNTVANFIEP